MLIYVKKVATLATNAELKAEQDKIVKLQALDSSYFRSKSHFVDNDGTQNYFIFQAMYRYLKKIGNTNHISEWKSKGLSDEITKPPSTTKNSLAPALSHIGTKTRVKFYRSCLKQDRIIFNNSKYIHSL